MKNVIKPMTSLNGYGGFMKTNIFKSDDEGVSPENGENVVNLRKRKLSRIYNSDGSYIEFVQGDTISLPDGQGNWTETELTCNHFNDQGNQLPQDLKGVAMSHAGRLVPPGSLAVCTSPLHPAGLTRNIYVDVDGSVTDGGAVCSICTQRKLIYNILMSLLGISVLLGVFKGFGWF